MSIWDHDWYWFRLHFISNSLLFLCHRRLSSELLVFLFFSFACYFHLLFCHFISFFGWFIIVDLFFYGIGRLYSFCFEFRLIICLFVLWFLLVVQELIVFLKLPVFRIEYLCNSCCHFHKLNHHSINDKLIYLLLAFDLLIYLLRIIRYFILAF